MDRFIDHNNFVQLDGYTNLKSNMDRFIDFKKVKLQFCNQFFITYYIIYKNYIQYLPPHFKAFIFFFSYNVLYQFIKFKSD